MTFKPRENFKSGVMLRSLHLFGEGKAPKPCFGAFENAVPCQLATDMFAG